MTAALARWATGLLLGSGFLFILFGIVGVLRLPDFYSRLHAQGKCDTLGVTLMLGGLALHELAGGLSPERVLVALKILAILVFIALANPTATHALGRAALLSGLAPWRKEEKGETR
ncbi:MAG: monovalent cation/H(+) antiporter subunit G [Elusimicrobiota bacterium]